MPYDLFISYSRRDDKQGQAALPLRFQESDLRTLRDQPFNDLAQIAGGEELVQATQAADNVLPHPAVLPVIFDNVEILIGAVVRLEGFDTYKHSTNNFSPK